MIYRILAAIALFLSPPLFAAASVQNPHTRVELVAQSLSPAPGQTLDLALVTTPSPGWHTYWKNPGDAGIETRVNWGLVKGASAAPFDYPIPGTLIVSGLMNYVYDTRATLLTRIKVPQLPKGSAFPIKAQLQWLVCSDSLCVPESATLDLSLTIGDGRANPAATATLAAARARLPVVVDWPARYSVSNGRFTLAVPFGSTAKLRRAYFFAARDGVVDYAAPQKLSVTANELRLETAASGTVEGVVEGVLKTTMVGGNVTHGFAIAARAGVISGEAAVVAADQNNSGNGWSALLPALLLAVAGGVVLNVMPCVFPILSLKALALAKGGQSEPAARRDALAYTGGIMMVCILLGAMILGLRAAGSEIGWAFQLQDPRVIIALLMLMTGIALNLAGLFEIGVSSGNAGQSLVAKGGASGSFWTGALAAFVATPCTGPFMAGALGAALVLPPLAGILIFAGLGFGLALPFLGLGFIPALRRRLPRPGAWMQRFRQLLSLPMFLTAAALAWVLSRQAGSTGLAIGVLAALILALALWWLGRRQRGHRSTIMPLFAGLVAASLAVVAVARVPAPVAAAISGELGGQRFSTAGLDALRASGTPVFVYFTADWCLTCKVNERGALRDARVGPAFARAGIAVLVGDWTNGDAEISRFIDSRGRAGVPLYLFYGRDGKITELPQILTASTLVALAG